MSKKILFSVLFIYIIGISFTAVSGQTIDIDSKTSASTINNFFKGGKIGGKYLNSGDTVIFHKGQYKNLKCDIRTPVTIKNKGKVVIQGKNILTINSDKVKITGLEIKGNIEINTDKNTFSENKISGNIKSNNRKKTVNGNIFKKNTIKGNLDFSPYGNINRNKNNVFTKNKITGFVKFSGSDNNWNKNTITGMVMFYSQNDHFNNVIHKNTINGDLHLLIMKGDVKKNTINGNLFFGNVTMPNGPDAWWNDVRQNVIKKDVIFTYEGDNNTLVNNIVKGYVRNNGSHNIVDKNTINKGLLITQANTKNEKYIFKENKIKGILMITTHKVVISRNEIQCNVFITCSENYLKNNKIKGNIEITTHDVDLTKNEIQGNILISTSKNYLKNNKIKGDIKITTHDVDLTKNEIQGNIIISSANNKVIDNTLKNSKLYIDSHKIKVTKNKLLNSRLFIRATGNTVSTNSLYNSSLIFQTDSLKRKNTVTNNKIIK